ncbi:MAG: hypothetical protein MI867_14615 [Pseudomonadales bacterium]|nr:hypothetical protein [Pseudomonadales bacterium]
MNDRENKKDNMSDEESNLLTQLRSNLRNTRFTGLGFIKQVNKETQQYIDNIKKRGEDKIEEITDESEKLVDRISVSMAKTINISRAYGLATYEEVTESGQKIADRVKDAFEAAKDSFEEDAEEAAISRLGKSVEQTNAALNSLAKDVLESAESFLSDAKDVGKDVDYELRKALFGRQSTLESRIQRFWKAIGLVNKQEMEEVNRKLVILAESLENQLDDDSKTLVYLNRRKNERRIQQVPVDIDKRVRDRRESDRKLAS